MVSQAVAVQRNRRLFTQLYGTAHSHMLFGMGARKLVAITRLTHVAVHGANRLVREVDGQRLLRG